MNSRGMISFLINKYLKLFSMSCLLLFLAGCLDPYDPVASEEDPRFLVVDGFLNATTKTCEVSLTRSIPLESPNPPPKETLAVVALDDGQGIRRVLTETSPGVYQGSDLPYLKGTQVKLTIKTKGNVEYESAMVTIWETSAIDAVNYQSGNNGVTFSVDTHDPINSKTYYSWRFNETWSYPAAYSTKLTLNGLTVVEATETYYQCWRTLPSTEILVAVGSLEEKDVNRISQQTVAVIPWESAKLQERYSMELEQRAISKEAYEYLQQLKKNTENLGTLFDPLPSQPSGNMRSVTNPGQLVLGFFNASTVDKKRIFIRSSDINRPVGTRSVTGYEACILIDIMFASQWLSYQPVGSTLPLMPYVGTYPYCVDCRTMGGTTVAPDFWIY